MNKGSPVESNLGRTSLFYLGKRLKDTCMVHMLLNALNFSFLINGSSRQQVNCFFLAFLYGFNLTDIISHDNNMFGIFCYLLFYPIEFLLNCIKAARKFLSHVLL